ncbi:MAG: hypothetical protein Q7S61_04665 [bacterium]|nr:hypothetical protein [bacterium]
MQSILQESKSIKQQADDFLKDSGVLLTLQNFGKVRLAGSYDLDLMLTPDIDIYVNNPRDDKNVVIKALNTFIQQGYFNGYLFYDFIRFHKKGFPDGYYIGLKTPFRDTRWKIDVWFFSKSHDANPFIDKIKQLPEDIKITILKLKKFRDEKLSDRVSSYCIYEAVIKNNIKTEQEFNNYLKLEQTSEKALKEIDKSVEVKDVDEFIKNL